MEGVIANIGALLGGVFSLYSSLHPALQRLFAISFWGFILLIPVFAFFRRLYDNGSY